MKFKNIKELRSLSGKDLLAEIKKAMLHLAVSSFKSTRGDLKDSSQKRKARKYIAQSKTIINERKQEETAKKAA